MKEFNYTLEIYLQSLQIAKSLSSEQSKEGFNYTYGSVKKYFIEMFRDAADYFEETKKALFPYLIGDITQEDIDSGNYEAQYIWFHLEENINAIENNRTFKVKSGHSWGNPYTTIENTSSRASLGRKIPLAIYYHKKRNTAQDLDDIYHPMMINDGFFMPYYGSKRKDGFDGGTEIVYMLTPEFKLDYVMKALNENKVSSGNEVFYPDSDQTRIVTKWLKTINDHLIDNSLLIRLGLFWKCRKGKTPGVEYLFENTSADILIALSRMGNVKDEWASNPEKFSNFHMNSCTISDLLKNGIPNKFGYSKTVITDTIQLLEKWAGVPVESNNEGEEIEDISNVDLNKAEDQFRKSVKEKLVPLLKSKKILLALDEADNGGLANLQRMIIRVLSEELGIKVVFDVSGTGTKLYLKNEYFDTDLYTLLDEIKVRDIKIKQYGLTYDMSEQQWINKLNTIDLKKDPDARILFIPTYKSYCCKLPDLLTDGLKKKIGAFPEIRQWLDIDRSNPTSSKYYSIVSSVLCWMFGIGKFTESTIMNSDEEMIESPFFNKGFINDSNKTDFIRFAHMIFVERTEYGRIIKDILMNHPPFAGNFEVLDICGNAENVADTNDLNKRIKDGLAKGKFVVVLSAQMYGVGATLEMVRFVHHLNDGTSYARNCQNGYRGTSNVFGKKLVGTDHQYKMIFKKDAYDIYYSLDQFYEIAWNVFDMPNTIVKNGSHFEFIQTLITNYMLIMGMKMSENDLVDLFNWVNEQGIVAKTIGKISSMLDDDLMIKYASEIYKFIKNKSKKDIEAARKDLSKEDPPKVKNTNTRTKPPLVQNMPKLSSLNKVYIMTIDFIKSLYNEIIGDYMKDINKIEDLMVKSDSDFEFLFSNRKEFALFLIEKNILNVESFNGLIKIEKFIK